MASQRLRATEAAKRLGITTEELLRLVHDRRIRFVLLDGIAHIPEDAVEEYQSRAS
jgi:excisionase family DNA binding protein